MADLKGLKAENARLKVDNARLRDINTLYLADRAKGRRNEDRLHKWAMSATLFVGKIYRLTDHVEMERAAHAKDKKRPTYGSGSESATK